MTDINDREILSVLDRLYDAWADNDAEAFVSDYTEDATSILPGSYSASRTAVRARMAAAFAGPLQGSRVVSEVQSVRRLGAEAAIVVTRDAVLTAGEIAAPDDRWVIATWTLTRRHEQWLLAAYHNCSA